MYTQEVARNWRQRVTITSRAQRLAQTLPTEELHLVVSALAQPFQRAQTKKMVSRKDVDLWRVEASRDVRITYRVDPAGAPVILHIGRHAASDDFITNYRPRQESGVRLEVCPLLKNQPQQPPTISEPPSQTPIPSEQVESPSAPVALPAAETVEISPPQVEGEPVAPSSIDAFEQLGVALSGCVRKLVSAEVSNTAELALQEADRLGRIVQQQECLLEQLLTVQDQQHTQIEDLQTEIQSTLRRLDDQITHQSEQQRGLAENLSHLRTQQNHQLTRLDNQAESLRILTQAQSQDLERIDECFEQAHHAQADARCRIVFLEGQLQEVRVENQQLWEVIRELQDAESRRQTEEKARQQRTFSAWLRKVGKRVASFWM